MTKRVSVFLVLLTLNTLPLRAQGTKFTYQGHLRDGANPASGSYDIRFGIWDVASGGIRQGDLATNAATAVSNGVFTVALDFGPIFNGGARWLELDVRTNGGDAFTTLAPRQALTPTPYAIHAGTVNAAGISGTIGSNMLAPGAAAANLAASGQSAVPSGAMLLTSDPNAGNLIAAGYTRLGGALDLSWQLNSSPLPPVARGNHTAVWTGSRLIVWGGTASNLNPLNSGGSLETTFNTWAPVTISNSPSAREGHSAVWSGSEMIVWGGHGGSYLNDGGRYNPTTDIWLPVASSNAPAARRYHKAVWTGSEMVVWGGNGEGDVMLNTGARYNPASDIWTPIATNDAPAARMLHTALWTGNEMIVWGGLRGLNLHFNDGARYNPSTDTWSPTSTNDAPAARYEHTAIWTGKDMIIWGGRVSNWLGGLSQDGARFNPTNNTWSAVSNDGSPSARAAHTAVWTGNEMIVWAGTYNVAPYYWNTGGRYNPATESWSIVTTSGAPGLRQGHTAVWTGSEMIVFGGYNNDSFFGDTYFYAPSRVMYLYLRQ